MTQQNFILMLDKILPQLTKIMIFQYLGNGKIRMNNNMPFEISFIPPHLYKSLENSAIALIEEVYKNMQIDLPKIHFLSEEIKKEFLPKMQYSIYGIIAWYEYFISENIHLNFSEKDFLFIANKLLKPHKQIMIENIL